MHLSHALAALLEVARIRARSRCDPEFSRSPCCWLWMTRQTAHCDVDSFSSFDGRPSYSPHEKKILVVEIPLMKLFLIGLTEFWIDPAEFWIDPTEFWIDPIKFWINLTESNWFDKGVFTTNGFLMNLSSNWGKKLKSLDNVSALQYKICSISSNTPPSKFYGLVLRCKTLALSNVSNQKIIPVW